MYKNKYMYKVYKPGVWIIILPPPVDIRITRKPNRGLFFHKQFHPPPSSSNKNPLTSSHFLDF